MSRSSHLAELSLTFSRTAFLLWETKTANYNFADWFNRLYNVSLARNCDLVLPGDFTCPFFSYFDEVKGLLFVFIDNPHRKLDSPLSPYDKVMLINGRDAFEYQKLIYDDYASRALPPPADELLEWQRYNMLCEARSEVFTVHYFDYRKYAEQYEQSVNELCFVRQSSTAKAAKPQSSPVTTALSLPESSMLAGIKNPNSRRVHSTMKEIFIFFDDLLHSIEDYTYRSQDEQQFLQ